MTSAPPYPFPGGTQGDEPPDPVAGQPGHFAWSRWIKEFVKRLDATDTVLDAKVESKLDTAGGTVTGNLVVGGDLAVSGRLNAPPPTVATQVANKAYVDRLGTGATARNPNNKVYVSWGTNGATTSYVIPLTEFTQYGDNIVFNSSEHSLTINAADTYLFNYTVLSDSWLSAVQRHVWMEFKQVGKGWVQIDSSFVSGYGTGGYAGSGFCYLNGSFVSRPFVGNAYRLCGKMTALSASPAVVNGAGGGGTFRGVSLQAVKIGAQVT